MTERLEQAHFVQLERAHAVWLDARECMGLRFPHTGCTACADVCPVDALERTVDSWRLREGCMDCGRCAARCPTEALLVTGFDFSPDTTAGTEPLRVDCRRVPVDAGPGTSLRVPCLGGISADNWFQLLGRTPRGVLVHDRGLCAACPAGDGDGPPLADIVDTVNSALETMSLPSENRIRVESRPLRSGSDALVPIGEPRTPQVSRRGLWKALATEALRAGAESANANPPASLGHVRPPDGRARVTPRRRLAFIAGLRSLEQARGQPLPASLFPSLTIAANCRDHNLCVRLCPTGALELREAGTWKAVRFDPSRCVECSACLHACPEGAIDWSGEETEAHRETRELIRHDTRTCTECGAEFVGHDTGGEDHPDLPTCPACRKSRSLMRSLFSGEPANPCGQALAGCPRPQRVRHTKFKDLT